MKKLLVFISIFMSIPSIFIATPDINQGAFHSMEFERQNDRQLPLEMQNNRRLHNEFSTDLNNIFSENNVLCAGVLITMISEMFLIEQMNSSIAPVLTGTAILAGGSMLGGFLSAYQMSNNKDSLDDDNSDTMNLFGPSMILPVMGSLLLSADPIMTATENKAFGLGGMIGLTFGSLLIGDIIGSRLYRYRNE